jgi:hypothetical protein
VRLFGSSFLLAIAVAVADQGFVPGPSFLVRPASVVRPSSFVPGPAVQGPGTEDPARTKNQEPSTKDQSAPWFGTWQQVPPATQWFNPWPYQKVTLRIEPSDDGLRVVYDMVRRRGGITHMEWAGRFDGRDYAVQGVDYVLTNAYTQISERSYQIVVRVDGREAAVATAVVSADGSRMTVDTVERDRRGQRIKTQAVYVRLQ